MVVTALLPVVVLLLIMPIGLLGIVLFIVGLVKKKPAMWGSGIAVAVLGLLVFAVGAGALMWLGVRGASVQRLSAAQAAAAPSMSQYSFKRLTGLTLPKDVTVKEGAGGPAAYQDDKTYVNMLHLSVRANFEEFLSANFTKAQWQDVATTFQAARSEFPSSTPSDSQLQAMALYSRTPQPDPNTSWKYVTVAAYDADARQAWLLSMKKVDSDE